MARGDFATDETTDQHQDRDQHHPRYLLSTLCHTTMPELHPLFHMHARIPCREVEYCAISTDENSCGGPKSRIANTEVGGGLTTTMYAALALPNEEWSHATSTPSPRKPWQVGRSYDVQVAALVLHYTELFECPRTSPPRSHTFLISQRFSLVVEWEHRI